MMVRNLLICLFFSATYMVSAGVPPVKKGIQFEYDGPYVFIKKDRFVAKSIERTSKGYHVKEVEMPKGQTSNIVCKVDGLDEFSFTVPLRSNYQIPASTYPQPNRLYAISDIEGNFEILARSLIGNGVIDEQLNWSFGDGHLVLNGDFFDRGVNVTACLWLLYKLEAEAEAAGGQVHFILGNHEEMNLRGDIRYLRDKYKVVAKKMGVTYKTLFGEETVLGEWLRSKNAVERIGHTIFVHGGLSPKMAEENISLDKMNKIVREYLGQERWQIDKKGGLPALIYSNDGPMWYRGYFGEKLSREEMVDICKTYEASQVIVGHTIVNEISTVHGGRVLGIDVKHEIMWSKKAANAILWKDGQFLRVDPYGKTEAIQQLATSNTGSIFEAIRTNDFPFLKRFIKRGNDLDAFYSDDRYTLIHYAIKVDQPDVVNLMLDHGANPDRMHADQTALMYAIKQGKEEMVQLLLQRGANIHSVNSKQQTALNFAAEYGSPTIAKLLVDHGASRMHKDHQGRTPLQCAIHSDNQAVIAFLKSIE